MHPDTKTVISVFSNVKGLYKALKLLNPLNNFYKVTDPNDKALKESEIIVADFDLIGPFLNDLPKVKWIQGTWAGIDSLMPFIKNNSLNFIISRFSGTSHGHLMAEYVVSNIINRERNAFINKENQCMKKWDPEICLENSRPIYELSIGIMGLGAIGTKVAEILHCFGATIIGYGRSTNCSHIPFIKDVYNKESLSNFLAVCDYIVNVLPSTIDTAGLLNGGVLKNCSERKSVLINIGRGTIVSEKDLIDALNNNWLGGAILDVFSEEPLPSESVLWSLPQVTITPHIAGPTRAMDLAKFFTDNLRRFYNNEEIPYKINLPKGY